MKKFFLKDNAKPSIQPTGNAKPDRATQKQNQIKVIYPQQNPQEQRIIRN